MMSTSPLIVCVYGPAIQRPWVEGEVGPEIPGEIVPSLDDEDLDQHLERPDIELVDGLSQHRIVRGCGADQQAVGELVRHDRDLT